LHEHLGDVLKGLGRLGDARKQWERALEFSVEAEETARLKDKLKESQ
jgi:predicted RNA polymerase sigma factor